MSSDAQTYVQSAGRARDQEYYKMQNIIPVFKLTSDTIEENNAFGVEDRFVNQKRVILLPEQTLTSARNGYGYLYFGANTHSFALGYTLFIITNNSRNDKPSLLFLDRNNDFDLSNDGPPDTLYYGDNDHIVFLTNPQNLSAKHIIRLTRFDYSKQYKYIMLADSHFVKHSGTKEYMGTFYSFREQRLNLLAANYRNAYDSFTIGFKDENCNGVFTDEGVDKLIIADFKSEKFASASFEMQSNASAYIETTGHRYKLTKLKPDGSGFYIEEVLNEPFQYQLNENEKVPHFKYIIADSGKVKTRKLCKHRKRPTYVYFTNSRAEHFDEDTATLVRIYNQYGHKINILMMNSGDIPRQAKKIAVLGNLPFYCGISSAEIDELWYLKTKPAGFFLKKRLKLQSAGLTPDQLLAYLNSTYDRREKK